MSWELNSYFHALEDIDEIEKTMTGELAFIKTLRIPEDEEQKILAGLLLDFIGGKYPVNVANKDMKSRAAMRAAVFEAVEYLYRTNIMNVPDIPSEMIKVIHRKYASYVSRGLDFETEEDKRKEEDDMAKRVKKNEFDRKIGQMQVELEFLQSLNIPPATFKYIRDALAECASSPVVAFNPNPGFQQRVHAHVAYCVAHIASDQYAEMAIMTMLRSYWTGRYFPDDLRWHILETERPTVRDHVLPAGIDPEKYGPITLDGLFAIGSQQESAKQNTKEDFLASGRAYQQDIQILRSLPLDVETQEYIVWKYKMCLLTGKFPITPSRELDAYRPDLERAVIECVEILKGETKEKIADGILHILRSYWQKIAQMPPKPA